MHEGRPGPCQLSRQSGGGRRQRDAQWQRGARPARRIRELRGLACSTSAIGTARSAMKRKRPGPAARRSEARPSRTRRCAAADLPPASRPATGLAPPRQERATERRSFHWRPQATRWALRMSAIRDGCCACALFARTGVVSFTQRRVGLLDHFLHRDRGVIEIALGDHALGDRGHPVARHFDCLHQFVTVVVGESTLDMPEQAAHHEVVGMPGESLRDALQEPSLFVMSWVSAAVPLRG